MRLTVKLPAIVVGAILLTAVASGVVSVVIGRNILRQAALDENVHRVEVYAKAVLFYVESARSLLTTTAELPLMSSLARPRELAALVLAHSDVFEYVTLLRPDGTVAMQEPRALEERLSHRDLSFSAWFAEVRRAERTVVSDLHISPATQRPTIVIATPVRAADGRTVGILAGALKLSELSATGSAAPRRSTLGGAGYVTDRRGLIIAHQSKPSYVEQQTDFSAAASVSAALAGKEGSSELFNPIENEQKLTAYRPLPDLGWAVVYGVPVAVALAPLDVLTRGILSASAALAALIGVGVYVLARRTVAPLARLSATAQTVGTGDFSQRIEAPSRDEIGRLAEEFNRMAGALAEKDALVRARAAELQTANRDLTSEIAERKQMEEKVRAASLYARSLIEASLEPLVTISLEGKITYVSERKRSEVALRESEERLRAIFEGALDGILVAEAASRTFLVGNPAICEMLGYTLEEITHLGVSDIHPEPSLPHVLEQFDKSLRGEIRLAADIPVKRRDGSVFYADIKAAPIRLGGKDGLVGIFRDATERRQAQESLRSAEEQFRGLVEQSIAGIYIIQDGKFAYVNQRFAEIFGYAADELLDQKPLSVVVEQDRSFVAEKIRQRPKGDVQAFDFGFTAQRKDGSRTEIGVHSARASHCGRPAIIGMAQDIYEKKRAEEQARQYLVQLETAFMSTVQVATTLSEMRDPYTTGHERRVASIAVAIGAGIGFDARRQEGLRVAGHLHDIGKITIPSEILAKPGKLGPIEYKLIQGHPQASYDVLKDVEFPWPVAEVALQHHERIDGSGYPQGLKGEAILLEARIMAVADVVEAMSSHRPYRPGLGIDKALAEIERGRGTSYDAVVADACLKMFREKGYTIPV
ncbi:MAG: PAS domain S-box protein [Betaproteobacteria bacterium]|nr:PAS domain S-box protein [Betaproteobacteria bacterium]